MFPGNFNFVLVYGHTRRICICMKYVFACMHVRMSFSSIWFLAHSHVMCAVMEIGFMHVYLVFPLCFVFVICNFSQGLALQNKKETIS